MNTVKISIILFLLFLSINLLSQESLDSLQQELYRISELEQYDSSSIQFVEYVFNQNIEINTLRASEAAAIGINIANNIGDSVVIARMQNLQGIGILKQRTYFMAIKIFFNSYSIFRKFDAKKDMANTLLLISEAYLEQGINDIAGDKTQQAIEIYREIGDSIGVANAFFILGQSYLSEDDDIAIKYLMKSLKIFDSTNNVLKLAKTDNLLATAYLNIGATDLSIDYLNNSLRLFAGQNNQIGIAKTYNKLGDVYFYIKEYKRAEYYFQSAKLIYADFEVIRKIIEIDVKLARLHFEKENYFLAIDIADSAVNNALLFDDYEQLYKSYKIISDCYVEINDIKKAFYYNTLYAENLNKYYQNKSSNDFSLFQMNLETEGKENDLEVLKMKSEKERLELANQQFKQNKIFIGIILFLIVLYLIFIVIQAKKRKKDAENLKKFNKKLKLEIEERKKAEFISKSNEKRYELLFSQTPVGILQFNENLYISNVNDRFAEIFDKKIKDIENHHLNSIFDRNTVNKIAQLFETKEEVLKLRNEIPTKKEVVYVSVTVKKYRILVKNEEVSGGIIIIEDFTEHKKAERYYKANILLKQMLVKQIPDDLILIDKNENILEIHFPDAPDREIGVSKLADIFKDNTLTIFRTHIMSAHNSNKTAQFFFSDGSDNYLVRIIPSEENDMIIISRFEGEAHDAGIIIKQQVSKTHTSKDNYLINIQDDIEKQLLPIYQNIQKGLSFIMIKNFAENILNLGKKYSNNKIIDFGERLLEQVTSFNVMKVNEILDEFPSFISQFMGISSKF